MRICDYGPSNPYRPAGVAIDMASAATGTATFTVTPEQFSYYDRTMTLRTDPGEAMVTVGPNASSGTSARIMVTA